MKLKIDSEKLGEIMQSFYTLTKIKIIIFDESHNRICSYPEKDCPFCEKLKSYPHINQKCMKDDSCYFNECKKHNEPVLYTCHAGLVECCAPLKYAGSIIGYIMFGQVSDLLTRDTLLQSISAVCKEYKLNEKEFIGAAKKIQLKSYNEIMAAVKIFEACISYIILNEMVAPESDKIITKCEQYIENNLSDVTVDSLCEHVRKSRTVLYGIFKNKLSQGISEFIRNKRLEKAYHILNEGNLSVKDTSEMCGFTDYNYFSRVFKKRYGKSPRNIQK